MGDDAKKKKSGSLGGLLLRLILLAFLVSVGFELAARFTGDYELSPLHRIQRLLRS